MGSAVGDVDAATGQKIAEVVYDDKDPETGRDLQERHKTLQMPVGLTAKTLRQCSLP